MEDRFVFFCFLFEKITNSNNENEKVYLLNWKNSKFKENDNWRNSR